MEARRSNNPGRPLIASGNLARGQLAGEVVIVTGAGGGCGFEGARALAWLGADVVIAEVDSRKGKEAAARIQTELKTWEPGAGSVMAVATDVSDERSVVALGREALRRCGKVDAVLNNATVAPLGAVTDVAIADWDRSYQVNVRGPVLLAREFLPGMVRRAHGVFVCVPSSGAAPYMGPYEVFKTAQVELANTLEAELEGKGVVIMSVAPGAVPTETMLGASKKLAPLYGLTVEQFAALSEEHLLSVEAAGAGFAAAIALAGQFAGQEIGCIQALMAAGIEPSRPDGAGPSSAPTRAANLGRGSGPAARAQRTPADTLELCRLVRRTLEEQAAGWAHRSLFERQWVIRDFKKTAGMPVEQWLDALRRLEQSLETDRGGGDGEERASGSRAALGLPPLGKLAAYYGHLADLAAAFEKDPTQRERSVATVRGWQADVERLARTAEAWLTDKPGG